ncbi:Mediator of RNA polymerase II transcription subunit 8 [Toxocara canis]|uniref:Mediator of RNA polymerase II transcription subunit 8 n=1 Tax=Toxocara canis TaxID=6265 RepID=A0A0B2VSQ5_TOXCA|nr:Mediator of RNA polymerase II transcription subunit 8 [Toxocara canis]
MHVVVLQAAKVSILAMNAQVSTAFGHQEDPEKFAQAVAHIESKAVDVKSNIEQLLFMLDLQHKSKRQTSRKRTPPSFLACVNRCMHVVVLQAAKVSILAMNAQVSTAFGHQEDPEKFAQAVAHIESKAVDVKSNIEQLLFMLDLQHKSKRQTSRKRTPPSFLACVNRCMHVVVLQAAKVSILAMNAQVSTAFGHQEDPEKFAQAVAHIESKAVDVKSNIEQLLFMLDLQHKSKRQTSRKRTPPSFLACVNRCMHVVVLQAAKVSILAMNAQVSTAFGHQEDPEKFAQAVAHIESKAVDVKSNIEQLLFMLDLQHKSKRQTSRKRTPPSFLACVNRCMHVVVLQAAKVSILAMNAQVSTAFGHQEDPEKFAQAVAHIESKAVDVKSNIEQLLFMLDLQHKSKRQTSRKRTPPSFLACVNRCMHVVVLQAAKVSILAMNAQVSTAFGHQEDPEKFAQAVAHIESKAVDVKSNIEQLLFMLDLQHKSKRQTSRKRTPPSFLACVNRCMHVVVLQAAKVSILAMNAQVSTAFGHQEDPEKFAQAVAHIESKAVDVKSNIEQLLFMLDLQHKSKRQTSRKRTPPSFLACVNRCMHVVVLQAAKVSILAMNAQVSTAFGHQEDPEKFAQAVAHIESKAVDVKSNIEQLLFMLDLQHKSKRQTSRKRTPPSFLACVNRCMHVVVLQAAKVSILAMNAQVSTAFGHQEDPEKFAQAVAHIESKAVDVKSNIEQLLFMLDLQHKSKRQTSRKRTPPSFLACVNRCMHVVVLQAAKVSILAMNAQVSTAFGHQEDPEKFAQAVAHIESKAVDVKSNIEQLLFMLDLQHKSKRQTSRKRTPPSFLACVNRCMHVVVLQAAKVSILAMNAQVSTAFGHQEDPEKFAQAVAHIESKAVDVKSNIEQLLFMLDLQHKSKRQTSRKRTPPSFLACVNRCMHVVVLQAAKVSILAMNAQVSTAFGHQEDPEKFAQAVAHIESKAVDVKSNIEQLLFMLDLQHKSKRQTSRKRTPPSFLACVNRCMHVVVLQAAKVSILAMNAQVSTAFGHQEDPEKFAQAVAHIESKAVDVKSNIEQLLFMLDLQHKSKRQTSRKRTPPSFLACVNRCMHVVVLQAAKVSILAMNAQVSTAFGHQEDPEKFAQAVAHIESKAVDVKSNIEQLLFMLDLQHKSKRQTSRKRTPPSFLACVNRCMHVVVLQAAKVSILAMNAQVSTAFGHQEDPEKFAQAVAHIESKAVDVKSNIEQLLFMLDLQHKVPWPDMLDKFSSLASAMGQLQTVLRKSALPSGIEDFGKLLRKHLLVPHTLLNQIDPDLQDWQNKLRRLTVRIRPPIDAPDMLDKFSSLASAMGQLQTVLRKSALPSGIEDFGKLLRKHLLVPHTLSNQIDPDLQVCDRERIIVQVGPDMLDKFSSLASAMGQLQTVLRKSALPSGIEDFGKLLRKHLLVPHTLSNQIDPDLQDWQNKLRRLTVRIRPPIDAPDMLDKFSSLASAMGQLQTVLRKSALPSGIEDFGKLLRKHLLVPHTLSNQIDPDLQQATQNRVHCWNHDVAPDYLRTKPNPEVEADEMQLDNEKNSRTFDQVNKQIAAMNKHLESLLNSLADNARSQADAHVDVPIYNNQDTQKLVRAVINGEGLRPTRGGVSAENASQAGSTSASSLPAGTHVPARTAASVMPQQQQQRR